MVVSYARPFSQSYAYGALDKRWTEFLEEPRLERLHKSLVGYRNTLLAHNDLSPHRFVVAFPGGGVLNEPVVTEGRSPIDHEGIRQAKELFEAQDERLGEESAKLATQLQEIEGWPPDLNQVTVTLDDEDV